MEMWMQSISKIQARSTKIWIRARCEVCLGVNSGPDSLGCGLARSQARGEYFREFGNQQISGVINRPVKFRYVVTSDRHRDPSFLRIDNPYRAPESIQGTILTCHR